MFDDNHGTEIYDIYFHGTERIWIEHTHRTDGLFFILHRCRGIYATWKRWEFRNIGRNKKLVHLRHLAVEKHGSNTRIKGNGITYQDIFRLDSIDRGDPSVLNAREISYEIAIIYVETKSLKEIEIESALRTSLGASTNFSFNPDFVKNHTRHLVKFS